MSEPRKICIVCSTPLPTGYRGRPRVVCSDRCYGRRRTILSNNATKLAEAKDLCRKLVGELSPWPELFVSTVKIFDMIGNTGPEVTPYNRDALASWEEEFGRIGEKGSQPVGTADVLDRIRRGWVPGSQATERREDLADVPKRLYGGDGPERS